MSQSGESNVVSMQPKGLVARMAHGYGISEADFMSAVRQTLMPEKRIPGKNGEADTYGPASDAEILGFLATADRYGLDVFTKQICAFPAERGTVIPVVTVDGWIELVNRDPRYAGVEFDDHMDVQGNLYAITAKIKVLQPEAPGGCRTVQTTEYLSECVQATAPWMSHPKRMLRHKAFIQAVRLAFGMGGLVDDDEARRIVMAQAEENKAKSQPLPRVLSTAEAQEQARASSGQAGNTAQGAVEGSSGQAQGVSDSAPESQASSGDSHVPTSGGEEKGNTSSGGNAAPAGGTRAGSGTGSGKAGNANSGSKTSQSSGKNASDEEMRAFIKMVAEREAAICSISVEEAIVELTKFEDPNNPGNWISRDNVDGIKSAGWLYRVYIKAKEKEATWVEVSKEKEPPVENASQEEEGGEEGEKEEGVLEGTGESAEEVNNAELGETDNNIKFPGGSPEPLN